MSTQPEAMKMALAALEEITPTEDWLFSTYEKRHSAIFSLREALAQPAQRTWIGLTDEEISEIAINNPPMVHEFAQAIEAKLKEKNT